MLKNLTAALILVPALALSAAEGDQPASEFGKAGIAFRAKLAAAKAASPAPEASTEPLRPEPQPQPQQQQSQRPQRQQRQQREQEQQPPPPPPGPPGIVPNVLVIGDSDRRGSGFLCELWGVPVLITNAHVYAQMQDTLIQDSRQNNYQVRAALVSRTRDIALLEVDLPKNAKPLKLDYDVGHRRLDSPLWAFGDSSGTKVVVELYGKLLGIGPDDIEISAGIVPGNSGGPVVGDDGRIIGMSSYLLYNRSSGSRDPFAGTRFGSPDSTDDNIRRFALRIDNLRMDDFEIFDPELQQKDLDLYRHLADVNREFIHNISGLNLNGLLRLHYREYCSLDLDWKYRPSIRFLEPMLNRQRQLSCVYAAILGAPIPRISAQEQAVAKALFNRLQGQRQNRFSCRTCSGSGKIASHSFRSANSPGSQSEESKTCTGCFGIGQSDFPYYNISRDPLSGRVKAFNAPFKGLLLGLPPEVASKIVGTSPKFTRSSVNGVIELWSFPGNPSWPRAKTSYVTFTAGRVNSVKVVFDAGRDTWESLKKELTDAYGAPALEGGEEKDWAYTSFVGDGFDVALAAYRRRGKNEIWLIARHTILQDLMFQMLDDLDGLLFSMPLPAPGARPEQFLRQQRYNIQTNPELFP